MAGPTTTEGKGRGKTEEPRKSREAVNYRRGEGDRTCRACRFYAANMPNPDEGATRRCLVMEGEVSPDGLCDRFERCEQMAEACYAVLVPVRKGLDDVLIFPFGTYYRDGERREFAREDGEKMVKNFDDDLLERQPPVNLEHERTKGRVGYISRLWVADDGVRGEITPLAGQADVLTRFTHVSPEVKWEWQHPFSGETHRNVLMGAGATNYPYLLGKMALHNVRVWTAKGEWEPFSLRMLDDAELFALYERLKGGD